MNCAGWRSFHVRAIASMRSRYWIVRVCSSNPHPPISRSPGKVSQVGEMARIAVVLMNLGGPNAPGAVEPFLYNLFSDPAIIRLPGFLRLPLAKVAARRRAHVARDIYQRLGGSSPLLASDPRRDGLAAGF